MISVYVKHFLNEDGKNYFDREWFPKVKKRLSAQEGFISIGVKTDAHPDCRYITVRFDQECHYRCDRFCTSMYKIDSANATAIMARIVLLVLPKLAKAQLGHSSK